MADNIVYLHPAPENLEPKFDHDGPFRTDLDSTFVYCRKCGAVMDLDELLPFLILKLIEISETITEVKNIMDCR